MKKFLRLKQDIVNAGQQHKQQDEQQHKQQEPQEKETVMTNTRNVYKLSIPHLLQHYSSAEEGIQDNQIIRQNSVANTEQDVVQKVGNIIRQVQKLQCMEDSPLQAQLAIIKHIAASIIASHTRTENNSDSSRSAMSLLKSLKKRYLLDHIPPSNRLLQSRPTSHMEDEDEESLYMQTHDYSPQKQTYEYDSPVQKRWAQSGQKPTYFLKLKSQVYKVDENSTNQGSTCTMQTEYSCEQEECSEFNHNQKEKQSIEFKKIRYMIETSNTKKDRTQAENHLNWKTRTLQNIITMLNQKYHRKIDLPFP